jgi:Helix-turn-helix domain
MNKTDQAPELISTTEAASILGVSDVFVRYLINSSVLLPAVRNRNAIFIERRKVDALLEARIAGGYKSPVTPAQRGSGRPKKGASNGN